MVDFRQGDVGFIRCAIPKTAKRIKTRPFALGEVTGHSHRVLRDDLIEMYEDDDGTVYVKVIGDDPVLHEDHDPKGKTSVLPAGWEGKIAIAGEYDEEKDFRPVLD